jgi:hypothetical protein
VSAWLVWAKAHKLIVAGVLIVAVAVGVAFGGSDPYDGLDTMTCDELTGAMLAMTGTHPTEAYDADRARRINIWRDSRGCA